MILFNTNGYAQEFDISKYRTLFNFKTIKQSDNSRILEVSFLARNKKDRKDRIPIYEAEIDFYNVLDDQEILMGSAKTTQKGIAQLILTKKQQYLKDKDGFISMEARFKGSDSFKRKSEELIFKDLHLELELTEIDSVKTVLVKGFTLDSLGAKQPIEEADIIIAVQGMLSKMNLEEETLEDGELEFEFPTDIPGDYTGQLTIFALIEDNDDFGDIIQEKPINWGAGSNDIGINKNTLWSEVAPIWMYVVLGILLVGIWANYIYTLINIFKIKKEGKELQVDSN